MENALKKLGILILWSCSGMFSAANVVAPKIISNKRPLSLEFQTERFHTTANFVSLGAYADLENGNSFSYQSLDTTLSYSPFSWVHLDLFLNSKVLGSSYTDNELRKLYKIPTLTYTGLDLTFAGQHKSKYAAFGLRSGLALEKFDNNSSNMIVSDGSHFVQPHLLLIYEYKKLFYVFHGASFKYRLNHGLSSLTEFEMGGVFQTPFANLGTSAKLSMPLGIADFHYVDPDKKHDLLKRVNGGSYAFYSVNPVLLSFTGWVDFNYKYLQLRTYANYSTYGKASAKGLTLGLSSKFIINTRSQKRAEDSFMKKYRKKLSRKKMKREYYKEDDDVYENEELKEELKSLNY